MFVTPTDFLPYLSAISAILAIGITIGGFSFRNGRQERLTKIQSATVEALEQRTAALEGKISDLEKENIIQGHIIDTITTALKQRGIVITINGDMVTIQDEDGHSSTHRKHFTNPSPGTTTKKEKA